MICSADEGLACILACMVLEFTVTTVMLFLLSLAINLLHHHYCHNLHC